MRYIIAIFIGIFIINLGVCQLVYAQSWEQTLAGQFDIVDTFDNYQSWKGQNGMQGRECVTDRNDLPKYQNGSAGQWDMYCHAADETPFDYGNWIANHGSQYQVGTKSLKLSTHGANPTDVKMYIGNGNPNSGYSEIYVFFRVYFPRNSFPTYVIKTASSGGIVGYKSGDNYMYLTGWKFFNIGTGFCNVKQNDLGPDGNNTCGNGSYGDSNDVYGDEAQWINLRGGHTHTKQIQYIGFHDKRTNYSPDSTSVTFDELGGIEYHFKLENPAGYSMPGYKGNGILEVWWYDHLGNATKMLTLTDVSYRPSGTDGHLFNRLWINGNKHSYDVTDGVTGEYFCGTGMNCFMYIDDFIVDDKRIGPKYFNLLGLGGTIDKIAPNPPKIL